MGGGAASKFSDKTELAENSISPTKTTKTADDQAQSLPPQTRDVESNLDESGM